MFLSFAKPKRAKPIDEWKSIAADGAPPGVYTSNMSQADRKKWKAKVVGIRSGNVQIEIRSEKPRANLVVVVNGKMPNEIPAGRWTKAYYAKPHEVKLSANGPTYYDPALWAELHEAVAEAHKVLLLLDNPTTQKSAMKTIRAGGHPLIPVSVV